MSGLLDVDEARRRVLRHVPVLPDERVGLLEALGRVLAEPIVAPVDLPPWPNSAMDGFAVRAADVPGELRILETVGAGAVPMQAVGPGTATRIMTGAPVPDGADSVVMVEDTVSAGDLVRIDVGARPGQHVRLRGADVTAGTRVAEPGLVLGAGALGLLASLGHATVSVRTRPRVGLLSTGDEVVEPGRPLGPGQIWSSNSHALAGLVRDAGAVPVHLGNVRDDPAALREAFTRGARCDVLVSTGGVSVGDFDHVKAVLGGGLEFWRVDMKPGKPLAYGALGGTPVFGLPGNPVSCMVNFLQFVRPVLRLALGDPNPHLPVLRATLTQPLRRHPGRPEFVRVALRYADGRFHATPAGGHQGSGNVRSMADAHGLALVAGPLRELSGDVDVQVFDWRFFAGATAGFSWGPRDGADDAC